MDYMMMRPDGSFVTTGVENETTVEVSYQEAQDFLARTDVVEFRVDDESYNKGYRFYEVKLNNK